MDIIMVLAMDSAATSIEIAPIKPKNACIVPICCLSVFTVSIGLWYCRPYSLSCLQTSSTSFTVAASTCTVS